MIGNSMRQQIRRFMRRPATFLLVIVTLALGIGATTAVFSAIRGVLYGQLPYPRADRIVALGESRDGAEPGPTGYTTFDDWRANLKSFSSMFAAATRSYILTGGSEAEQLRALGVTHETFSTLGVRPLLGRDFTADDDRRTSPRRVILSEELWARRFGSDPKVIGRIIPMSGINFEVIGVMPRGVRIRAEEWKDGPVEAWVALRYDTTLPYACRDCRHVWMFGRLRDGVSPRAAAQELAAFTAGLRQRYPEAYPPEGRTAVAPFVDRISGRSVRSMLWAVMGAALLVLVLAVSNAAGIRLAELLTRREEIQVRLALGARPGSLAMLLIAESVFESLVAAGAGIGCAALLIQFFRVRAAAFLPRASELSLDGGAVAIAFAVAIAAGILVGAIPALRARRWSLRSSGRTLVSSGLAAHALLVTLNVAIAAGLLASSVLLVRSLSNLFSVQPGLDPSNVMSFHLSLGAKKYDDTALLAGALDRFVAAAESREGVRSVALTTQLPFDANTDNASMVIEERASNRESEAPGGQRFGVSPRYFETLRIPIREGRAFNKGDRAASEPVVIVNERAARELWPGSTALGRRVRIGGGEGNPFRRVVGIAGDVVPGELGATTPLQAYIPLEQFPSTDLIGVAKIDGATAERQPAIRAAIAGVDPDAAFFSVRLLSEMIAASESKRSFVLSLLSLFSIAAFVLAMIGIYAIVALLAASRTREIGLRLALGSSAPRVFRLLLGKAFRLVVAGVAAGLLGSFVLGRMIQDLLFHVANGDTLTLMTVALLLVATSFVACAVPALRAARLSPMDALRED